jgi:hypothetical protein
MTGLGPRCRLPFPFTLPLAMLIAVAGTITQAGCNSNSPNTPTQPTQGFVTPPAVMSVIIGNVPSQGVEIGTRVALRADAKNSANQTHDCTNEAVWTSSNPHAVEVVKGVATVNGAGAVTISATCGGVTGSAEIPIALPPPTQQREVETTVLERQGKICQIFDFMTQQEKDETRAMCG